LFSEATFISFVAQTTSFVVAMSSHITDNHLHPYFLVWWIWMQQFTIRAWMNMEFPYSNIVWQSQDIVPL